MASDIDRAVQNHDEMVLALKRMKDNVVDIGRERQTFILHQDKIRGQIKDFENFLNESRAVREREYVELKKEVTKRLDESAVELREMVIDRRQLKAMVKN